MAVEIRRESPLQADVRGLISELNAALLELTPPEFCYHMTAEEMAGPETTVFVARESGRAIGCGALRRIGPGEGEVKRMYVRPERQSGGIGGQILDAIEAEARAEGIGLLLLETGDRHPAAWRLYERGGFKRRGAFGEYPDNGRSVFYEKRLSASGI